MKICSYNVWNITSSKASFYACPPSTPQQLYLPYIFYQMPPCDATRLQYCRAGWASAHSSAHSTEMAVWPGSGRGGWGVGVTTNVPVVGTWMLLHWFPCAEESSTLIGAASTWASIHCMQEWARTWEPQRQASQLSYCQSCQWLNVCDCHHIYWIIWAFKISKFVKIL